MPVSEKKNAVSVAVSRRRLSGGSFVAALD
jgi:hypothetical protein